MIYCKNVRQNNETTRARRVICNQKILCLFDRQFRIAWKKSYEKSRHSENKKSLPKYLYTWKKLKSIFVSYRRQIQRARFMRWLRCFLNCGMRLSELVSIDYNDIKADGTLVITGKGNKERTVYLNQACINAVTTYIESKAARRCKRQSAFFKFSQSKDKQTEAFSILLKNI